MTFKKTVSSFLLLVTLSISGNAQNATHKKNTGKQSNKPKLVIGLVVDQMRWDYLYKYKDLYGKNGFARLLNDGFSCENTLIKHIPTYTAVGHTGIYSGSIPVFHGIIGNYWYDKKSDKLIYCTGDSSASGVGSDNANGKMSPKNLGVDLIGDELRLSNNFNSKVIGIAMKDRSAILSAGQSANAAYWFDDLTGKWISSNFYMTQLPKWVEQFNNQKQPDVFCQQTWNTLLSLDKYDLSTNDHVDFESNFPGEKSDTFPHHLTKENKYEAFKTSPFGITFTLNFAKAAIENEKLGEGKFTDLLTVSISSTDNIGHYFGPNSVETEDTYLRLDHEIASFIDYLDNKMGRENYVLMLTADHGVGHNSTFLEEHRLKGSRFSTKELAKELNGFVNNKYGVQNGVKAIENLQIYLNDSIINHPSHEFIINDLIKELKSHSSIASAFEFKKINQSILPENMRTVAANSYNESRSGDIQIVLKPGNYSAGKTQSTHGLWNPYDSHIPLIFFGSKIKSGKLYREVQMADIAPTLSALLNIQMPNGCIGKAINELF